MVTRIENPATQEFLRMFNSVWQDEEKFSDLTEDVIEMISSVYQENAPELVYFMIFKRVRVRCLLFQLENLNLPGLREDDPGLYCGKEAEVTVLHFMSIPAQRALPRRRDASELAEHPAVLRFPPAACV